MDEKFLYYIWLSDTFYAGSHIPKLLLSHFNSINEIFAAGKDEYSALDIPSADIKKLCNKDLSKATAHLNFCKTEKIGILCYDDPFYPERLKIIDNPPPMFYYRGRIINLDDYPCIAMVGTRSCSERGFRLAYETAYDASSKGAVTVNGLALGIDGACIAASLDANGYAVGVLGCGIDRIYPYDNKEIFKRLSACGLILSEFAPFTRPEGKNFPVRNRVISGLSLACCIFEADAAKSGAMITAQHALNQGRRIFAVPAKPYDKSYSGPLELIKNGASVFTEADDVLSEYSLNFPHRINLANRNDPPIDKLNRLVAKYFGKDIDPEVPVNRRHVPQRTEEKPRPVSEAKKAYSNTSAPAVQSKPTASNTPNVGTSEKQTPSDFGEKDKCENLDVSMLSPPELQVYETIKKLGSPTADDIASSGMKIEQVLSALTLLEIYECIVAVPGGRYRVKDASGK